MRSIFSLLLIVLISSCSQSDQPTESVEKPEPKTYKPKPKVFNQFVFAKSGLNMREEPELKSKVIQRLPLGAKVEVHDYDFGSGDMIIEGLKGKMVKVKSQGKEGYVFSGYLNSYLVPDKNDFGAYANKLQMSDENMEVNYKNWDEEASDSSHYELHEELTFPSENTLEKWQEFFMIAQKMGFMNHDKSFVFAFPNPKEPGKLINIATKKEISRSSRTKDDSGNWVDNYPIDLDDDLLWFINIEVATNNEGELIYISESTRQEGGGQSTTIGRNEEDQFVIKRVAFAD